MIPDALLNQCIAVTGRIGSGKTYMVKGLVERMLDQKRRVCVIDPTDSWWGLRSSADGKKPGYPVVVFGGDHADVPVNAHSGPALAEFVATHNAPCIIATADMRIDERRQFMADFLDGLFRQNKTPLHLILDEADELAPQNPMPDTKVVLHRTDRIVRRGRIRGFRVIMITQRPAVLNKNVLTQASALVALRLMSPQDRKAIDAWIEGQGDIVKGKEVLATLAQLKPGEGWVWAPELDMLERLKFPRIKTFDSSAAPKEGEIQEPKRLAEIDLSAIKERFAEAEKEAEANDPKLLRARIAELERQARQAGPTIDAGEIERARQAGMDQGHKHGYRAGWLAAAEAISAPTHAARNAITDIQAALNKTPEVPPTRQSIAPFDWSSRPENPKSWDRADHHAAPVGKGSSGANLPVGERAILIALGQHRDGCTREQLSVLTGYKRSSRDAYISRLQTRSFVEQAGIVIRSTAAGIAALGKDFDPLPTGAALQTYWLQRLPEGERRILSAVIASYPLPIEREAIDKIADYKRSSRDAYIHRLKARQLINVVGRGEIRASDNLF